MKDWPDKKSAPEESIFRSALFVFHIADTCVKHA